MLQKRLNYKSIQNISGTSGLTLCLPNLGVQKICLWAHINICKSSY